MKAVDFIVPGIIALTAIWSMYKRVDVYDAMIAGAEDGLKIVLRIIPALIALLTAVHMMRASGALDSITSLFAPIFRFFGIPEETAPLVFIRPISGSAGLAIAADLITTYGPDSTIGRTAAVMMGSTETTFYTISVYFGSCGINKTRYAIPAALIADLTGFAAASLFTRLFF